MGFLNGDNYYFSKINPLEHTTTDFLHADRTCYHPYEKPDMYNYSTNFYRHKAIDILEHHDRSTPLFLYLPFQAVHDPFSDIREGADGAIPKDFITADVKIKVMKGRYWCVLVLVLVIHTISKLPTTISLCYQSLGSLMPFHPPSSPLTLLYIFNSPCHLPTL